MPVHRRGVRPATIALHVCNFRGAIWGLPSGQCSSVLALLAANKTARNARSCHQACLQAAGCGDQCTHSMPGTPAAWTDGNGWHWCVVQVQRGTQQVGREAKQKGRQVASAASRGAQQVPLNVGVQSAPWP